MWLIIVSALKPSLLDFTLHVFTRQAKGDIMVAPLTVEVPELYLQGEAATGKISLPPPLKGRDFHLFCSPFNAGAQQVAEELRDSSGMDDEEIGSEDKMEL